MSGIDIRHPHTLSMEQARTAVDQVADSLRQRFDVACEWRGDALHFSRPGVNGRIALEPRQLHVTASLGLLFSAMRGPIEAEVRRVLAERF